MALFEAVSAAVGLYSTVRNVSASERYFGFLPNHGKRLAAGEEITVYGDVQHHMARQTPNERARRSLDAALSTGTLVIAKSPVVYLFDEVRDLTRRLRLNDAVLGVVDPAWGAYSSSV